MRISAWSSDVCSSGLPGANATGTAIDAMHGGGHRLLVTTTDGGHVGRWLANLGTAAFVVRYRLFREEGSPYTLEEARADVERAVRTVRSRAGEYAIDSHRIGIWGFSAGGELARMTALSPPVPARDRKSTRLNSSH